MQLYILIENIAVFAGLSAETQENGFINYVTFLPMQPSVFVHCVHVSPAQMKVQTDWIARKNIVRTTETPSILFPITTPGYTLYIINVGREQAPALHLYCSLQHILNKNTVAGSWVVHKNMGDSADEFAILNNR